MTFSEEQKSTLMKCGLLKNADAVTVINLLEKEKNVSVEKLETTASVFHMSDKAGFIGIILKGQINVEKLMSNGTFISIARKNPGEMIGEAAAFSRAGIYPCELTATQPSEILMVPKEAFLKILGSDSHALENFLTELSTMTFMLQSKVELLSYSSIASKIAFFLLTQQQLQHKDEIAVPENMTHLSSVLHVSRPSMYREIRKLEKQKLIKIEKNSIHIINAEGLKKLLEQ